MPTIDITPTDEGFRAIAALFRQNILSSVPESERSSVLVTLEGLIEVEVYLAKKESAK